MNVLLLFAVSIWFAVCATIYAFLTDHDLEIKRRESILSNHQFIALYGLRFTHYVVFVFFSLYAFVADLNIVYDFIVFVSLGLIYVQWTILETCALSMIENRLLFGSTSSRDLQGIRQILLNVDRNDLRFSSCCLRAQICSHSQPWVEILGIPSTFLYEHVDLFWLALAVLLARIYYSYNLQ
jgi:hypothetical protein